MRAKMPRGGRDARSCGLSGRHRTILLAFLGAVLVAATSVRIWQVNARAFTVPVETYRALDVVSLDGAFSEYEEENTDGYSVRVLAARLMSVEEYLAEYSEDKAAAGAYLANPLNVTDPCARTLVVIDIEATNAKVESDERGYLDSIGWSVTDLDHPELWIRAESELLACSIPRAQETFKLSIRPQTSLVMHVPFAPPRLNVPFPGGVADSYLPVLEPGGYEFVVTKAPVRKTIELSVR